ncbi:CehA/McbA family metallohydrolase, partial [Streptomyces goshikiensis]
MGLSRRELLASGAAAATPYPTHAPSPSAPRVSAPAPDTRILRGTIPPGAPDFVEVPLDVPPGVRELRVAYTYDRPPAPPGVPGNALDIGIFDQRGTALGGRGFRGWSGGARGEFFL